MRLSKLTSNLHSLSNLLNFRSPHSKLVAIWSVFEGLRPSDRLGMAYWPNCNVWCGSLLEAWLPSDGLLLLFDSFELLNLHNKTNTTTTIIYSYIFRHHKMSLIFYQLGFASLNSKSQLVFQLLFKFLCTTLKTTIYRFFMFFNKVFH